MKWIGLTGGVATGKSQVSKILRGLGVPVIDADFLAREVVKVGSEGLNLVVKEFGEDILNSDGSLNRAKLAGLVFSDAAKRKALEEITHPLIRSLAEQNKNELISQKQKMGVYDVPLLFENNMQTTFDEIIVVSCNPENQKNRLMKRDKLTPEEAMVRMNSQMPMIRKVSQADYVIDNNGSLDDLIDSVEELYKVLKS